MDGPFAKCFGQASYMFYPYNFFFQLQFTYTWLGVYRILKDLPYREKNSLIKSPQNNCCLLLKRFNFCREKKVVISLTFVVQGCFFFSDSLMGLVQCPNHPEIMKFPPHNRHLFVNSFYQLRKLQKK